MPHNHFQLGSKLRRRSDFPLNCSISPEINPSIHGNWQCQPYTSLYSLYIPQGHRNQKIRTDQCSTLQPVWFAINDGAANYPATAYWRGMSGCKLIPTWEGTWYIMRYHEISWDIMRYHDSWCIRKLDRSLIFIYICFNHSEGWQAILPPASSMFHHFLRSQVTEPSTAGWRRPRIWSSDPWGPPAPTWMVVFRPRKKIRLRQLGWSLYHSQYDIFYIPNI